MVFVIDAHGNVQNTVPERVYQGSNLANYLILTGAVPYFTQITTNIILPNGVILEDRLMTAQGRFDGESPSELPWYYWTIGIDLSITQFAGEVEVQFHCYNLTQIVATGSCRFVVEPGVDPELPEEPTPDIYQQILQAMQNVYIAVEGAKEAAAAAETAAEAAQSAAAEAVATANAAKETAEGIDGKATQAMQDASNALTLVNTRLEWHVI